MYFGSEGARRVFGCGVIPRLVDIYVKFVPKLVSLKAVCCLVETLGGVNGIFAWSATDFRLSKKEFYFNLMPPYDFS
jgi:hypothetical protein